jgi:predicted transposase/invertase (TIGR01784 family)
MKLLDRDRENREEGRLEGREERTIEMAQNLLDVLSVEVIAQKTGLSIDEVNALKNGYN